MAKPRRGKWKITDQAGKVKAQMQARRQELAFRSIWRERKQAATSGEGVRMKDDRFAYVVHGEPYGFAGIQQEGAERYQRLDVRRQRETVEITSVWRDKADDGSLPESWHITVFNVQLEDFKTFLNAAKLIVKKMEEAAGGEGEGNE